MYITAIDIGTTRIKGVVAELKKDGSLFVLKTLKRPSAGMKRGEINHPEEVIRPLFSFLKEVRHFDKRCLKNLAFSISSTKSRFHISRGTISIQRPDHEILDEDIERVIKESMAVNIPPGWKVIHSFPREYIVDDIEVDDQSIVGLSGRRLEANVVLISLFASVYNNFLKVAKLVLGKKGDFGGSVFFAPIAAERAVLSGKQRELGVVCVDIGAQTTGIVVYQDGKMVHAKVLPVGSANITNDLAIGLKCSVEAAEKIKLEFGAASSKGISPKEKVSLAQYEKDQEGNVTRKYIAEIIEVRVRELLSMVADEIKQIPLEGQLPGGVVLTGGGAKIAGLLDITRQELRLPAHIGLPIMNRFEASNGQLSQQLDDPEMAVAVGMVLHRIGMMHKRHSIAGDVGGGINESRIIRTIKALMAMD